ncbi:hypothetical protein SAMN06272783_2714 [Serratia sp. JKS296]|nr:hypothetical protein SAMN06272783_2714 [Serratia sp. JKS296]
MLCLKRFHRQWGKGDLLLTQRYSFLKMFVFSAKLIVSLDLFLQSEVNLNYLVIRKMPQAIQPFFLSHIPIPINQR